MIVYHESTINYALLIMTLTIDWLVTGAGIGGLNGVYNGLKETKAAELTGAVRRTQ